MTKKAIIEINDEVVCRIHGLDANIRRTLLKQFEYEIPGAKYLPSVRLGRWNGKVSYFSLAGTTYINLLSDIVPRLYDAGYDIELVDTREYSTNFEFVKITEGVFSNINWPPGHVKEGQPIMLRDYQVDIVNKFLGNTQSIQVAPTGSGKCLSGETDIEILIDEESDFYKFLINHLTTVDSHVFLRRTTKNLKLPIGTLIESMAEFKRLNLKNNVEINTSDLNIKIKTPTGYQLINHVIKKNNLPGRKFIFDDDTHLQCADEHLLYMNRRETMANVLKIGEVIDSVNSIKKISSIIGIAESDYYDVSIDYPHIYVDSNGIIHHNTLITAALSYSVQNYGRSIVIVPNKSLVTQTETDYKNVGLDVGVYFGDRKETANKHIIATWQSLNFALKNTKAGTAEIDFADIVRDVVCVICDEAHSIKADVLKSMLSTALSKVPLRFGLTGTIPKEPYAKVALETCIGSVISKLEASVLQEAGVLAKCHVNIIQLQDHAEYTNYQSEIKYLLSDKSRLDTMASIISRIKRDGNTLILVDRVAAGRELVDRLSGSVFVSGETKLVDRKEEYDEVASSDNKIIVATYGVAAVGINIPRIFNLVLIEPGKSFVRVIQSIGRGLRVADDKDSVQIYDITSSCKFSKRHLIKRKEFYKEAKYDFTIEKLSYK